MTDKPRSKLEKTMDQKHGLSKARAVTVVTALAALGLTAGCSSSPSSECKAGQACGATGGADGGSAAGTGGAFGSAGHAGTGGASPSGGRGGTAGEDAGGGGAPAGHPDSGDGSAKPSDAGSDAAPDGSGCTVGFADCNGQPDDGCETDLASSADDCGVCGHSCLGGTCSQWRCDAVRLVDGGAARIAVDGINVYFIAPQDQAVRAVPVSGGQVRDLATGEPALADITTDGTNVYVAELGQPYFSPYGPGAIRKVAVTGGAPDTVYDGVNAGGLVEFIGAITHDADNVYWSLGPGPGPPDGALFKAPLAGGAATRVFPETGYIARTVAGALFAANGYVYASGGTPGDPKGGWVTRQSVAGDYFQKLWTSDTIMARGVTVLNDVVYFTTSTPDYASFGQGLFTVSPTGTGVKQLYPDGRLTVASDTSGVYYGTSDSIWRVPPSSGPSTLAMSGHLPAQVVLDAAAVYFIDFADGSIWRVAK